MKTKEELIIFLNHEVPQLLSTLTESHQPLWGAMDAQRMVEHLALGFKLSNGKVSIPADKIDPKASKIKVISLLSDRPLPRLFTNPVVTAGLKPYEHESLEAAKQKLLDEISDFHSYFAARDEGATCVHNLYGELNYAEWLIFQYKHVLHHFMQLGVVPITERIS